MARPPAPEIDHPYVFSVSQLETFRVCNRKWALLKIDGEESVSSEAAALGNRVHDILEDYLRDGIDIDTDTVEGQIAFPGIKFLPLPGTPGMRLEGWFAIQFGVAAYVGYKDIEIIRPGERPQVKDHKTTKDFKWKKSKKELLRDTQAGIYAADAMLSTGFQYPEVDLEWIYYKTKGSRKADRVKATISQAQVNRILTEADETAREMIAIKKKGIGGMEVTPNYSGCSKFGGCQFRNTKCKVTGSSVLSAIFAHKGEEKARMSNKTESFLAGLKKKKNKGGSSAKAAREIDVKSVDKARKVNPPERDTAKPPPSPAPKKVGEKYIQPTWNEAEWKWEFPKEEKTEKKGKKGKKGLAELVSKSKAAAPTDLDSEEESEEEDESEEQQLPLPIGGRKPGEPLKDAVLEQILDRLAELIVDKTVPF